jgi:ribosomal protein S27AE
VPGSAYTHPVSVEAPACPECGEDLQFGEVGTIESKGVQRVGEVIPNMRWHCDACGYEALPKKHHATSSGD